MFAFLRSNHSLVSVPVSVDVVSGWIIWRIASDVDLVLVLIHSDPIDAGRLEGEE